MAHSKYVEELVEEFGEGIEGAAAYIREMHHNEGEYFFFHYTTPEKVAEDFGVEVAGNRTLELWKEMDDCFVELSRRLGL